MSNSKRPNIVFIITDQQRFDTINAMGYPYMQTPVVDKLVAEGTCFPSTYVTSPSCGPSRASLFSGTYPHTNGVFRNDEPWVFSWVSMLNESGYHCVNVGKMHTSPVKQAFGYHERHVVENKCRVHPDLPFYYDDWDKAFQARKVDKPSRVSYRSHPEHQERLGAFIWEAPEDLHSDIFVPEMACRWLNDFPGDEPFFLQIGIPGPHPPYDPFQRYVDKYDDYSKLPKAIKDPDPDSLPEPIKALRQNHLDNDHDGIIHLENPTDEQIARQRAYYYANISMIDAQIGKVMDSLEERGVLDNTIIIFTSDHGDALNDHGLSQKWNMYESSVRVPLVIWGPEAIIPKGKRCEDLVSLFDLGPTILEFAGLEPPEWMEAQSLTPLLDPSHTTPTRDVVFSEHSNDLVIQGTSFVSMIRRGHYKLVHFVDTDEGQLFDLNEDPTEINNLWGAPAHAAKQQSLLLELLAWRIESDKTTQGFRKEISAANNV